MNLLLRCGLFIGGLFFAALGICLVVKSGLGASPISSLPYVLSLYCRPSLGMFTFIVNMGMLIGQILILRRQFKWTLLLQAPMTIVFSLFIDLIMAGLSFYEPGPYWERLLTVLFGSAALGFGVSLEVIGNVVMLPGEGLVYTIAKRWNLEFGKMKIAFDTSLVVLSAVLSLTLSGSIDGLREGTLLSAFLVGAAARLFLNCLSDIDESGSIRLCFMRASKRRSN